MRLFAAFVLDDHVRTALARVQKKLASGCDGVRWIPPEQLHMTVKFLGEVSDARVTQVSQALEKAAATAAPFTMTLSSCGCFPPHGPVRIVWAGAAEPSGEMTRSVASANEQLEGIGFAREDRPWSPHITIGRAKDGASGAAIRNAVAATKFEELSQPISSFVLMSSVLSPKGSTYTPVSIARFGKR